MESGFASVWSRVTGTVQTEDGLTKLRRWMEDEAGQLRAYEMILRGPVSAPVQSSLDFLLRAKQRHLTELRTLYYLRTGDSWSLPKGEKDNRPPLMRSLRELYAASADLAESYRNSGVNERDLAALCAELASDEDLNGIHLRRLVRSLLYSRGSTAYRRK